jgi:KDO2-lipid IV(A) lauroyltransferase
MRRFTGPDRRWRTHGLNNGRIFSLTYASVSRLPRAVSYGIGDLATWIAWRRMHAATAGVVDNLRAVLPGASDRELSALARATYRSYARDTIDFIRALAMPPAACDRFFGVTGMEAFTRVREAGRGALIVTGHFGNWEIGAVLLRHLGCPLDVVVMPEPDPEVHALRKRFRDSLGVGTIEVRQSLDTALQIRRRLAENRAVAMLMDRHVDRDRIKVRLFDRDAWFLRTPALLAYLSGAPLVPCFLVRRRQGGCEAILETPIEVSGTGDRDAAVAHAAQLFAGMLEKHVRARPECWYQFYPYWAVQADVARDLAGTAPGSAA